MSRCKFNEALVRAALALQDERLPPQWPVGIVRDVYGKLRFAVDAWRPLADSAKTIRVMAGRNPPWRRRRWRRFNHWRWSG